MSEIETIQSVEEIAGTLAATESALGHDPFDDLSEIDPFEARLDQLEARLARGESVRSTPRRAPSKEAPIARQPLARSSAPESATRDGAIESLRTDPSAETKAGERRISADDDPPRPDNLARLTRRRWSTTPPLSEIELSPPKGWADRLLNPEERRVLASLAHLVEGEAPYDRFGYSPRAMKNAFPIFHALYRLYFRVRSEGHEQIPAEGPVILAGNHGGLLPFDAAMGIVDIALHTDPPRLARSVVDRWAGALPWVNLFYARMGQIVGTRENFSKLLNEGQLLLVFPEGIAGIRKTIAHRYRLQKFRVGFIEHALRARAPIVPVAFIGSDDQSPILYDVKPLARRLGIPVAPITPTFPWLGPLGLLPYPISYRIVYGTPLHYHRRFGPEGANDARLVRYLANQVRRAVQLLIDRNRA